MNTSWQIVPNIKPQDLTESRLQLHYAIQFIAAVGSALAEPLPDYSHTSLEWHPDLEMFVGAPIRAEKPFRVALDPVHLISQILDKQGEAIASYPLHQQTLAAGLEWHKQQISQLGADASNIAFLTYPPDDFPDHPIARGTAFDASQAASDREELQRYYANTHQLLQAIVATTEDASPIHTWPHHFDMATLISLPGQKNGEPMTIGIGMSPGDRSYGEPYWYVSPYPYPNTGNLPPLEGNGFWHTQHWVGAVLTASRLTPDLAARSQVKAFLDSALQASKTFFRTELIQNPKSKIQNRND
ncbi:MAG: hypothetical protein KME17_19310 [Cyanosarcina radialis HA8281-LM2]|nr:hypothetical protein [Cyanosarcina radialis HA8281-LM2]